MPDWKDFRLDFGSAITIGVLLVSLAGVYFGMKARMDALERQVAAANALATAHERALVELTVTLKVKGVIQ